MAPSARAGIAADYTSEQQPHRTGLQRKSSVPGNDASRLATGRRFASSAWEQRRIVVLFAVERQYLEIHLNTEQLFDIVHSDDTRLSRFHSISGDKEPADPLNEHISVGRRTNPYWEIGRFGREETMRRTQYMLAAVGIAFGLLMSGETASATRALFPPGQLPELSAEWWQWAYSLPTSQIHHRSDRGPVHVRPTGLDMVPRGRCSFAYLLRA